MNDDGRMMEEDNHQLPLTAQSTNAASLTNQTTATLSHTTMAEEENTIQNDHSYTSFPLPHRRSTSSSLKLSHILDAACMQLSVVEDRRIQRMYEARSRRMAGREKEGKTNQAYKSRGKHFDQFNHNTSLHGDSDSEMDDNSNFSSCSYSSRSYSGSSTSASESYYSSSSDESLREDVVASPVSATLPSASFLLSAATAHSNMSTHDVVRSYRQQQYREQKLHAQQRQKLQSHRPSSRVQSSPPTSSAAVAALPTSVLRETKLTSSSSTDTTPSHHRRRLPLSHLLSNVIPLRQRTGKQRLRRTETVEEVNEADDEGEMKTRMIDTPLANSITDDDDDVKAIDSLNDSAFAPTYLNLNRTADIDRMHVADAVEEGDDDHATNFNLNGSRRNINSRKKDQRSGRNKSNRDVMKPIHGHRRMIRSQTQQTSIISITITT